MWLLRAAHDRALSARRLPLDLRMQPGAYAQLAVKTCQTMRGERHRSGGRSLLFASDRTRAVRHCPLRRSINWKRRPNSIDQQARRQIERAQYEADLACRRYRAVDPDNRLVARSLERDWNEQLLEVDRLEREYAGHAETGRPHAHQRSNENRSVRLLRICLRSGRLRRPRMPNAKQLLRWLIKDVTLAKRGDLVVIDIRWQTEARTSLSIPRLKKSRELRQTQPEVMARIRELGSHPFATPRSPAC